MARIEGVYQRYLKTIPPNKIKTLTPQESYEIDMKISEAFCKKHDKYCKKSKISFLSVVKNAIFSIFKW